MKRLCAALLAAALLCWGAGGEFSNTLSLESVTTFYSCTEAFPANFSDPFAAQACTTLDAPVTAIRYIVRPGEDDAEGGSLMAFYVYPPPFAEQPINQDPGQNGAPPDNPCAYTTSTTNCSGFANGDTTGPITLEVRATHVARRYYLRPILAEKRVPYTYTEHNLLIPRCEDDKNKCSNACDSQEYGVHNGECQPGDSGNKKFSQLACCAFVDDFYVRDCKTAAGGNSEVGSIYTSAQQYSHFVGDCGPNDESLLLSDSNTDPGSCRACAASYGIGTRPEAAQTKGNTNPVAEQCDSHGKGPTYQTQQDGEIGYTPVLHPTLCPVGVGHYGNYPTTTSDLHSHANGATDAYSLEPYYYWCQSQCVGDGSYTHKDVYALMQTQMPCATGAVDFAQDGGTPISDLVSPGGEDQFNYNQYLNAYLCSMGYDECPEVLFAHSVDEAAMPCCNSTFLDPDGTEAGGSFASTCANSTAPGGIGSNPTCGGIAAAQVRNAAAYLTAACDAVDSGESLCSSCNSDNNLASTGPHNTPNLFPEVEAPYTSGWQCPGWPYDHLRPAISLTTNLDMAKCSVECQTDEFIRWQVDLDNTQCTSSKKCSATVEQVVSERAIVEMGYGGCLAYEVVPEPILDIALQITLTAPDGTTNTSFLSTTSDTSSIAVSYINGVKFTHRINEPFIRGGAGPQIPGLILVCNPDLPKAAPIDQVCCTDTDVHTGSCNGNSYNPYDDESTAQDIRVPKPEEDPTCNAFTGGIRGVFPNGVLIDGKLTGQEIPQVNPWPQLVRKMYDSRTLNGNANAHESGNGFDNFGREVHACHVPAPRYLGALNCGKPVYWYYVPEERKSSIGLDCGKTGVQNDYARSESGRRTMCLQGGNSCTPGYGEPRFTESGAPFYRTPCQELGDMVKLLANVTKEDSTAGYCDGATRPSALDMPGFTYLSGEDVLNGDDGTFYPNTWVHGLKGNMFLYQQVVTSQQQNILLDVETYTDTFYGGNVQTYTDGILVPESSTICFATVNDAPGVFSVGVQNTNLAEPGTYFVSLACADTLTDGGLDETPTTGGPTSISPDGTAGFLVPVGPGQTQVVSWSVVAGGSAPTPAPAPAPTPSPTPAPTNIGIPTCAATLQHGGGDFAVLFTLTANCQTIAASLATPDRQTQLDQTIKKVASCRDYQFFCWLSNQGPIETFMVITIVVLLGVAGVVIAVMQTRLTVLSFFSRREMRQYTSDIRKLEVAREQDEASVVVQALSPQKNSAGQ